MKREHFHQIIYSMKVGQKVRFDIRDIADAFPSGWPTIYDNPRQALLSSLIGSGCGAFRAEEEPFGNVLVVSRHEEADKHYYVDPDREYLYNKMPDGTFEFKPEYERNLHATR